MIEAMELLVALLLIIVVAPAVVVLGAVACLTVALTALLNPKAKRRKRH